MFYIQELRMLPVNLLKEHQKVVASSKFLKPDLIVLRWADRPDRNPARGESLTVLDYFNNNS